MAIGVIWHPEIDRQTYEAISERVMPSANEYGMKFHGAGDSDGGMRIVEIWESREALDKFKRESLGPAIDEVSQGQAPAPEPHEVFEVFFEERFGG